jgi:hypothetical protein
MQPPAKNCPRLPFLKLPDKKTAPGLGKPEGRDWRCLAPGVCGRSQFFDYAQTLSNHRHAVKDYFPITEKFFGAIPCHQNAFWRNKAPGPAVLAAMTPNAKTCRKG